MGFAPGKRRIGHVDSVYRTRKIQNNPVGMNKIVEHLFNIVNRKCPCFFAYFRSNLEKNLFIGTEGINQRINPFGGLFFFFITLDLSRINANKSTYVAHLLCVARQK
ncbi:hypothetical protein [Yersinia aleksiciae]|uniref:hypothetical protein n=1 Tax=Yersinia aleksiciae TaxID=263819 RepID=UPI0011A2C882|nr:hypothetical protein [Yersinia aleksiciae]